MTMISFKPSLNCASAARAVLQCGQMLTRSHQMPSGNDQTKLPADDRSTPPQAGSQGSEPLFRRMSRGPQADSISVKTRKSSIRPPLKPRSRKRSPAAILSPPPPVISCVRLSLTTSTSAGSPLILIVNQPRDCCRLTIPRHAPTH